MKKLSSPVCLWRYLVFISGMFLLLWSHGKAQSVYYSQPVKDEKINTWFEILGRYDQKVLILKKLRSQYFISIYNDRMEWLENSALRDIPEKAYGIEVLPLKDFISIWYRETKGRITNWYAVKIGFDGKSLNGPRLMASKETSFSDFRPYFYLTASEDKSRAVATITQELKDNRYKISNLLLDQNLDSLHSAETILDDVDSKDYFTDFLLDNDGNLAFCRGIRKGDYTNLYKVSLMIRHFKSDTLSIKELNLDETYLDAFRLKIDNRNRKYLLTGFYYTNARESHIEGVINALFDKAQDEWTAQTKTPLDINIKKAISTQKNPKYALDDFYFRNILIRKDGSFTIFSEAVHTLFENDKLTRWDKYGTGEEDEESDEPPEEDGYGFWHAPSYLDFANNEKQYFTGNLLILDFDPQGSFEKYNVIYKDQASGGYETALLGYQTIVTSEAIHFFFNNFDKKEILLYHHQIDGSGNLLRLPAIFTQKTGNTLLVPSYGKQISAKGMVVPCSQGNNLIFARLEI
ncbi:MAG: hypothetical protein MUE71_04765 [Chitinophagaceae bacterium]|nr:hypothetical protein [Chitinophagaceae bacterium]